MAQDLIDRGVTSPPHLGCEGGSNGGLLVGNMLTHYPHLFGAIACEVPLLDMRRYTKLSRERPGSRNMATPKRLKMDSSRPFRRTTTSKRT